MLFVSWLGVTVSDNYASASRHFAPVWGAYSEQIYAICGVIVMNFYNRFWLTEYVAWNAILMGDSNNFLTQYKDIHISSFNPCTISTEFQ